MTDIPIISIEFKKSEVSPEGTMPKIYAHTKGSAPAVDSGTMPGPAMSEGTMPRHFSYHPIFGPAAAQPAIKADEKNPSFESERPKFGPAMASDFEGARDITTLPGQGGHGSGRQADGKPGPSPAINTDEKSHLGPYPGFGPAIAYQGDRSAISADDKMFGPAAAQPAVKDEDKRGIAPFKAQL